MNRNLDGTPLTATDLKTIAAANGLGDKLDGLQRLHSAALQHSALMAMTRDVRFDLFSKGLLKLDTRTDKNTNGRGTH